MSGMSEAERAFHFAIEQNNTVHLNAALQRFSEKRNDYLIVSVLNAKLVKMY
jgi:hypothetical protein